MAMAVIPKRRFRILGTCPVCSMVLRADQLGATGRSVAEVELRLHSVRGLGRGRGFEHSFQVLNPVTDPAEARLALAFLGPLRERVEATSWRLRDFIRAVEDCVFRDRVGRSMTFAPCVAVSPSLVVSPSVVCEPVWQGGFNVE